MVLCACFGCLESALLEYMHCKIVSKSKKTTNFDYLRNVKKRLNFILASLLLIPVIWIEEGFRKLNEALKLLREDCLTMKHFKCFFLCCYIAMWVNKYLWPKVTRRLIQKELHDWWVRISIWKQNSSCRCS